MEKGWTHLNSASDVFTYGELVFVPFVQRHQKIHALFLVDLHCKDSDSQSMSTQGSALLLRHKSGIKQKHE